MIDFSKFPLYIIILPILPLMLINSTANTNYLRIVGGSRCEIDDHPFIVQIHTFTGQLMFSCGGSLISYEWVLTAAHCLKNEKFILATTKVVAGTTYAYKYHLEHPNNNNNNEYEVRTADRMVPHPKYERTAKVIASLRYDIGVVKVLEPFPRNNPRISVIKVPPYRNFTTQARDVLVLGWGAIEPHEIPSRRRRLLREEQVVTSKFLKCLDITLVKFNECRRFFPKAIRLNPYDLCSIIERGEDTCQGDSGGPVVYEDTVIGIVSLGLGCAQPGTASVYTRVDGYFDFLTETTGLDMPEQEPPEPDEETDYEWSRSRRNSSTSVAVVFVIIFYWCWLKYITRSL